MPEKYNNIDNLQLRSEEVQEIITKPPGWLIRWGITLIFIIASLLISLTFFIRYPDFISSRVLVTTTKPIERIIPQSSGQIEKILVSNGEKVKEGQPLAIIKNTSDLKSVLELKRIIEDTPFGENNEYTFPMDSLRNLNLGLIEIALVAFERSYLEFHMLKRLQLSKVKKEGKGQSISEPQNSLRDAEETLISNHIYQEYEISKSLILMLQAYHAIKTSVNEWEHKYMLFSSTDGIISFHDVWGENQNVSEGVQVFSILPDERSELLCKMKVSSQNAGKINIGQAILIKLDNFPFRQFGYLKGEVSSISVSPDQEGYYIIYGLLREGTETSYGKKISMNQELLGLGEIMTENLSVAQRFFFKLRSVAQN